MDGAVRTSLLAPGGGVGVALGLSDVFAIPISEMRLQRLPRVFHGVEHGAALLLCRVSRPEIGYGAAFRSGQLRVDCWRKSLSRARVAGSKGVTVPLPVAVVGECELPSQSCDAPVWHSNASTSSARMRNSFPPSRKQGSSPRSIMFRTWRSEQAQRSASMPGV